MYFSVSVGDICLCLCEHCEGFCSCNSLNFSQVNFIPVVLFIHNADSEKGSHGKQKEVPGTLKLVEQGDRRV